MPNFEGYPIGVALAFLFVIGMLRGQATYWIARYVTEQTLRRTQPKSGALAAVHRWLSTDAMNRGRGAVERYGVLAVALCYLTVGLQTVILASAGVIQMRWLRFSLAQAVGAAMWAVIYATIGFAVWLAFFEAALVGGPIWAGLILVALIVVIVLLHRLISRGKRKPSKKYCIKKT